METNKIATGAISISIVAVIIVLVALPLITNTLTAPVTYDNTGGVMYSEIDDEKVVITVTDGAVTISIDDATPVSTGSFNGWQLYSDNICCTCTTSGITVRYYNGTLFAQVTGTEYTVTAEDGSITVAYTDSNDAEQTLTKTYTHAWYYDTHGKCTALSNAKVYVASKTDFNLIPLTAWATEGYMVIAGASYVNAVATETDQYTVSSITRTTGVSSIDCTALTGTIIVPDSVTGTYQTVSDTEKALINTIPILLVMSLIIGAVGFIVSKRNE